MASIIRDSYSHLNSFVPLKKRTTGWPLIVQPLIALNTKRVRLNMSNPHKERKHDELCSCESTAHKMWVILKMRKQSFPNRKKQTCSFLYRKKTCNTLPALMQHKDDISSYILYRYGLISLAKLKNIIKKHISPLLLCGIVELWSVNMVPNTIKIIVKTVIINSIADRNISTTTEYYIQPIRVK